MKILSCKETLLKRIIAPQGKPKGRIIWSNYSILIDTDEGCLVYNTLTKSLILIEGIKAETARKFPEELQCKDELIGNSMLVEETTDEYNRLCSLKELLSKNYIIITPRRKLYSIFTTLGCNARCFYCFENGIKRTDMSMDTALATAEYISKTSNEGKVTLKWFGGEPLVNQKAIEKIVNKLKDERVEFNSIMFSNGYLFNIETIEKALLEWNLNKVTITLDGTEETYNRTKAFINAVGSPYQRVLENIGLLLEKGIKVSIRLNLSLENSEEILRLVEELFERFKRYENISYITRYLYEYDDCKQKDKIDELINCYKTIKNRIKQLGMKSDVFQFDSSILNNCMAESDDCIVVLPDGKLTKCQHYITEKHIGDIWKGIADQETIKRFKEREHREGHCEKCLFAPTCTQLKMCPFNCNDLILTTKKIDLEYQMHAEYERWKKEQQAV